MSPLPLVPAPTRVVAGAGAAFLLTQGSGVRGDADAVAALRTLVLARTGIRLGDRGDITLSVEKGGAPESYSLRVTARGVTVIGADVAGLFYGIQTLGQLIGREGAGWAIPAVDIEDAPRFAYRGMMLDVARHFFPVEVVQGVIDRAASLKLNRLHLHLSDDQGWRLELRSRPELTARGSGTAIGGDSGGFYTAEDYRRIVSHAASRHVVVVPEFDVPGHTHAVGLAYPHLAADPVLSPHILEVVEAFGGGIPTAGAPYTGLAVGFSSLRIGREETYDFLADVFGELASLTPGPYLHLGGDEALGTDPADYREFIARATRIVADLGKTPVVWHEAGVADLPGGTVGQFWGLVSPDAAATAAAQALVAAGAQLLLSPADAVYLDMKDDPDSALGLTWADGPTSLHRAYAWEPADLVPGVLEGDILGVEAPMWTETIRTAEDIDTLAFPRIAAAAEIAWSPASGPERTWASFRARVGGLGPLWTALGIRFRPLAEVDWVAE